MSWLRCSNCGESVDTDTYPDGFYVHDEDSCDWLTAWCELKPPAVVGGQDVDYICEACHEEGAGHEIYRAWQQAKQDRHQAMLDDAAEAKMELRRERDHEEGLR